MTGRWSIGNALVFGAGGLMSNLKSVKSDTVLPTARHCCDVSFKGSMLPGQNDAEMSRSNSLHASA